MIDLAPETLALHGGGFRADPTSGATVPPIHFTTSYQFRSAEHARRLFALEEIGYTYTRTVNPTREILERRLVALEGGTNALAVSSGTAATLLALLALAGSGDNLVIAASSISAAPVSALSRYGLALRVVAPDDPASFVRATDSRTRAWFAPSVDLATLEPFPIAAVAAQARVVGLPLIIDNSNTPLRIRPGAEGAAVVVYDAATFLGGHAISEGGILIDTGRFNWAAAGERLPSLNQPNPSYHGAVWSEVVQPWGASPYIARARGDLLRDLGVAISPMAVFHLLQGLETLPLRLRTQTAQAAQIVAALSGHPYLSELRAGAGALVRLDLPESEAVERFLSRLTLVNRSNNGWGSVRSTARPAPAQQQRVLLSVGIEHPEDIIADLAQALTFAGLPPGPARGASSPNPSSF